MKIPSNPPQSNTPSSDVATQQWVSTYYQTKAAGNTVYRKTTSKQVVSTVSAIDLLNGEVMVGAGVMGTNKVLRLTAWGDCINNTGATQSLPAFALLFGGSTIFATSTFANFGTSATRRSWYLVAEILNLGNASSQFALIRGQITGGLTAANAAAFSVGTGQYNGLFPAAGFGVANFSGGNTASVNTSITNPLVLQGQLTAANASLDVTLKGALIEII